MPKVEITLPTSFAVVSRGLGVDVNVAGLSPAIIEKLVLHGLTQKVADAAAGAKKVAGDGADEDAVAKAGQSLMQKVVDRLVAGEWGVERAAGSSAATDETAAMRYVLRPHVAKKVDGWKELDEKARVATIDRAWAGASAAVKAKLQPQIDQRIAAARAAREARKAAEGLDLGEIDV